MSFLSSLADKPFKIDESGKIVFFPWVILARATYWLIKHKRRKYVRP